MTIVLNINTHSFTQFPPNESVYDRSLRKLRKKVRFNIAMGQFKPTHFLTLTYDKKHFEEQGRSVNVSKDLSQWLKSIKRRNLPSLQYVWRLEIGQKGTNRIHVHLLTEGDLTPYVYTPVLIRGKIVNYLHGGSPYEWDKGHAYNEQILDSDEKVANYLTKYLAKTSDSDIDEEVREKLCRIDGKKYMPKIGHKTPNYLLEDPLAYGDRRFGCSQGLLPVPKSIYRILNSVAYDKDTPHPRISSALKQSQICIEHNLELAKKPPALLSDQSTVKWLNSEYKKPYFDWHSDNAWFQNTESKLTFFQDQQAKEVDKRLRKMNKIPANIIEEAKKIALSLPARSYKERHSYWSQTMKKLEKEYKKGSLLRGSIYRILHSS